MRAAHQDQPTQEISHGLRAFFRSRRRARPQSSCDRSPSRPSSRPERRVLDGKGDMLECGRLAVARWSGESDLRVALSMTGTVGSLWRHGRLRLVPEVRLAEVAKWSVIGGGEGFFDVLIIRVVPLARTCGMRVLLNCVRCRSEFSNSVSWASCAMSCMLLRLWVGAYAVRLELRQRQGSFKYAA
jgi:hypothetical protein